MVNLSHELIRGSFAEFVCLVLYVFIGCLSTINDATDVSAAAHGLAIAVLTTAFAKISGGHFNTAVTLGIWMAGEIKAIKAAIYIGAQIFGGFIASLLVRAVMTKEMYQNVKGGVTIPTNNVDWYQALICEIVITYILVQVVMLTVVDEESRSPLAPFAIGVTIVVGILAGAKISGGSMNPARSFGPAVVYSMMAEKGTNPWSYHYIYWIGPFLGSALAAILYRFSRIIKKHEREFAVNHDSQTVKYKSQSETVQLGTN